MIDSLPKALGCLRPAELFNLITVQIRMDNIQARDGSIEGKIPEQMGNIRHKLALRFNAGGLNSSQSKVNESCQGTGNKKRLSSLEVFRKIVQEKHILAQKQTNQDQGKLCKKLISSELRNGIVKRAFSRTKLEMFTRADPEKLKTSLKCRVNSMIQKAYPTEPCLQRSRAAVARPLTKLSSHFDSKNLISDSQSNILSSMTGKKRAAVEVKARLLKLKDFPEECRQIKQFQERVESADTRKSRKARTNLSLIIKPVWGGSVSKTEDFLPSSIRVSLQKDREIINGFNTSLCFSNRGSHMNTRPSNSRDPI